MYYVYIARCADGTFYTGYAKDLNARINTHNEGKGAKYTRNRRPIELVYSEAYTTNNEALKREYQIKQLTRKQKEQLISQRHFQKKKETE